MTQTISRREQVFRCAGFETMPSVSSSKAVVSGKHPRMPRERKVPLFIPAEEAYYWSSAWQRDAMESMRALREGDFEDFNSDDPTDVARWLLTVDEDDCD